MTETYPTAGDLSALDAIVRKANDGDQKALAKLRKFLDENPQVWQHVGDLARTAEHAWITLIANGSSLAAEAVQRRLAELKSELAGDSATVVEEMLADTVLATWLEVYYLQSVEANTTKRTMMQGNAMSKRRESAQRRHLNALKQLTQIKKLLPNRSAMPELRLFRGERETA